MPPDSTTSTSSKRRTRRRRLAILAGLTVLAAGIAEIIVANSLVASANHRVAPPPDDLNVVVTTIDSESGTNLATWYVPASDSHATIVLLHPIRANRWAMMGRAELLHDAGYTVVMVDLQAHGESPGDHLTMGYLERHDVQAAVEYARKTNPQHRIGVVGWSLGGAATLLACPLQIDAAVLESVYPTITDAVHNRAAMRLGPLSDVLTPILLWQFRLRLGISASDLRPIDHIAEICCPVLIIGGAEDEHTTLAQTKLLFDSAREPKKLVVIKGAAHTDYFQQNPKQYEAEVLPFLASHLSPTHGDLHSAETTD